MPVTFNFVYTLTCDTCSRTLDRTDLSLIAGHPVPAQLPTAQAAICAAIADGWLVTPSSVQCLSCRPSTPIP